MPLASFALLLLGFRRLAWLLSSSLGERELEEKGFFEEADVAHGGWLITRLGVILWLAYGLCGQTALEEQRVVFSEDWVLVFREEWVLF